MNRVGHIKDVSEDENGYRQFIINCLGNNDQRKYFSITPFGIDYNAPIDTRTLTIDSNNKDVKFNVGVLNIVKIDDLVPGESAFFSTNEVGDTIMSQIVLRNTGDIEINKDLNGNANLLIKVDGTMEFNGDVDTLSGFTELKAGFDQGIIDLNETRAELNKITAALTNWTPAPQDGGAALKVAYSSDPSLNMPDSTTNIDASEKQNLKTE
jgi:hypothetical protein